MLSSRVKVSSRLNSWKTKPSWSRRKAATSFSGRVERSTPSRSTFPPVGLSRAASRFSRVVLPLPDSPMMATYSPFSTAKFTRRSASTCWVPKREV